METIRFIGHLYPRATLISITLPDLDWPGEEKHFRFRTKINNSIINVECDIDKYEPEHLDELYIRAFDLARTAANLVCFATGEGVISVFEFAILPDGTQSTLRLFDPSLQQYCTAYNLNQSDAQNISDIVNIIITERPLFMALNDLIECVAVPQVERLNCGRVIDSIRRQIAPNLDDTPAWAAMRKALNISEQYLKSISKQSTGPRHGDNTPIAGTVSTDITKKTWVIMDRYLEYRKRGRTDLILPQFPELVETNMT